MRTLTFRCLRLCYSSSLLQSGLSEIKKFLLQNCYSVGIISYNMNDVLNRHQDKFSNLIATVPKKDIILVLPYLGFQSELVTRRLKSCINKFYGFVNLKVIFQSTCRIKYFPPYKGRLRKSQKSNVVYKASCWDCHEFYIGKKKPRLRNRKKKSFQSTQMDQSSFRDCRSRSKNRSQHKMGPFSSFSKW